MIAGDFVLDSLNLVFQVSIFLCIVSFSRVLEFVVYFNLKLKKLHIFDIL